MTRPASNAPSTSDRISVGTATCDCPPQAGSATCDLSGVTAAGACPTCGEMGKPVDTLTLKALLAVPLTEVRTTSYSFCRTADCPTVYFAVDGKQTFDEEMLRERVHQKHLGSDDVFVCYCFRHSPGSIKAELRQTGRTRVVEAITSGIQAGQCACDIRNPQGSCCLGNVRAVVGRLTAGVR